MSLHHNYLGIVVFCFCFDRSSRLIPSVSAFSPSNLRFYISFRSFRPDFLSILNDRGIVPPWKHFSPWLSADAWVPIPASWIRNPSIQSPFLSVRVSCFAYHLVLSSTISSSHFLFTKYAELPNSSNPLSSSMRFEFSTNPSSSISIFDCRCICLPVVGRHPYQRSLKAVRTRIFRYACAILR